MGTIKKWRKKKMRRRKKLQRMRKAQSLTTQMGVWGNSASSLAPVIGVKNDWFADRQMKSDWNADR